MLVFLDFDGVLRCEASSPLYGLEASRLGRFEAVLGALPGADVVVSSSWREAFTLPEIRAHFSEPIRARIVGVTPILLAQREHKRFREVSAYLKRETQGGRAWVALDDQREHYPVRPNIRILDSAIGFDDAAAQWLLAMGQRYGAGRA